MIKYVYLHHWSIIVCHYSLDTYFPLSLSLSLSLRSVGFFQRVLPLRVCVRACGLFFMFLCTARFSLPKYNWRCDAPVFPSRSTSPLPAPTAFWPLLVQQLLSLSLSLSFSPAYPMISDFHVFRRVPHLPEIRGARSVERSEPRVNGKLDCPQRCLDSLSMLRVPLLVFHVFHSRFRSFFFLSIQFNIF